MSRHDALAALGVALFAALLHLPLLGAGFTLDDTPIVLEKADLRSLGNWRSIVTRDWWGNLDYDRLWRPLTLLTFAAQGTLDPRPYHAVNLALDALVAGLVVLLGRALGASPWAAAAAGALFAALGVHLEPVAGIVGRADLLAAAFALAALLFHRREGWLAAGVSAACFAAALVSKESAVTLPAVAVALDLAERRPRPRRWALLFLLLGAALGARYLVLGSLTRPIDPSLRFDNPLAVAGWLPARLSAIAVLGRYALAVVWPVGLSPNYGFDAVPIVRTPADAWFLAGLLSHGALLLAAIVWARRARALAAAGAFLYLLALFPLANLAFLIGTIRAERLLYLPSAGLCLLAAAGLDRLAARSRVLAVAAALAAVAYQSAITRARAPLWQDDRTLLGDAARAAPRSFVVRYALARTLLRAGDAAAALGELRAAVDIAPDNLRALHELGDLERRLGLVAQAEARFLAAVRLEPRDHIAWNFLGSIHAAAGERERALEDFTRAVAAKPGYALAHANRGTVLLALGREAEALAAFDAALAADPALGAVRTAAGSLRARLASRAP